jgi:hypothetical protein
MLQQGGVPLVQGAASGLSELVGGCGQVVAADHLRNAPQFPQGPLESLLQGFVSLTEGQVHKSPPRVAEDQLEEEVGKGLAGDGDLEFTGVGEIQLGFPAGGMYLGEEDLLFRSVQSPPVPNSPLQGAQLGRTEASRVAFFQPLQDSGALQCPLGVLLEQGFNGFTPDRREGVGTGPPGPWRLPL